MKESKALSDQWTPEDFKVWQASQPKNGNNKYGAKRQVYDGKKFASIKELETYKELVYKQKAGEFESFECHVKYDLIVNGIKVSRYTSDFNIKEWSGRLRVVDTKSEMTRKLNDYIIRKKLMLALHNISIEEW